MRIFEATVTSVTTLSSTLRRIRFALDGFESTGVGDEYIRLFFPHTADRRNISLPTAEGDSWRFDEGQPEAPMRTYTIRDAGDGWIDIDFVIHEGGIAAEWARSAAAGDKLGLNSPTGLYERPDDCTEQVLLCDLTGLPAAARLLETTPDTVRTRLVVEIPDEASRIALPTGAHIRTDWLIAGNGIAPSLLPEAARTITGGLTEGQRPYLWVAGQSAALRQIRKLLRRELKWSAQDYKIIGYWIPDAETWREKYEALDPAVKEDLLKLWDRFEDVEEATDVYEAKLERLGL